MSSRNNKKAVGRGLASALMPRSNGAHVIAAQHRVETMRILREVRHGFVNEADLDYLHNYVQMTLALIQRVSEEDVHAAWNNAQIQALLIATEQGIALEPDGEEKTE